MHATRLAGLIFVTLVPGCAGVSPPAPDAASTTRAPQPEPAAAATAVPRLPLPVPAPPAVVAAHAPPTGGVPADGAKPKAPTLDLATLEQRLRETKAIGVLTKLTLKNQIDDLLSQFRAYYQGKLKASLADLRRSYDLLFLKVLSLLQDGDQALAAAIASSREAIWGILSDPAKFTTI